MSKPGFIYGIHAVRALILRQPQRIKELYFQQGRQDQTVTELMSLAEQNQLSMQVLDKTSLQHFVGEVVHQGVIAECLPPSVWNENDLMDFLDELKEEPFLLILDGVQDPHNLGACLRSAEAAGVHAVIVPKDKAVGLTPVVTKVACGAADILPLVQVTNLARVMEQLKKRNIWLYGAAGEAEHSLYKTDLRGAIAIVLGAEGEGLRRLTRENCDALMSIPMQGLVDSLNVSVATGVCLFEALRQRNQKK